MCRLTRKEKKLANRRKVRQFKTKLTGKGKG
jgi:hypothetical protein